LPRRAVASAANDAPLRSDLSDYLHARKLKFGIYTSKGPLTCLGYQPTGQPKRPGSCGFEKVDADTYVHDWDVDQVKDDGCGGCPQHEPFAVQIYITTSAMHSFGNPCCSPLRKSGHARCP